jgi:hypothetical protein
MTSAHSNPFFRQRFTTGAAQARRENVFGILLSSLGLAGPKEGPS